MGVSLDPKSQSLKTFTGPQDSSESDEDFNDRVFRMGQERYSPVHELEEGASAHRQRFGLPDPKIDNWQDIPVDFERSKQIAAAFDKAESNPDNKFYRAAYADLVRQTMEQWRLLTDSPKEGGLGVKVDFVTPAQIKRGYGTGHKDSEGLNPYPTAEAQAKDIYENHHLSIATIASYPSAYHPLLDSSRGGEYDKFRAVHDAFGHAAIGADFTRHGEYQAWLHHTSMFRGLGRLAASTELTGENSHLIVTHTPAEHKAAILPKRLISLPWDMQGNYLPDAWRGVKVAKASKRKAIGGDPQVVRDWGVVNSHNALHAKIARSKKKTVKKYDTSPLGTGKNWVTRQGGLPLFVRAVAHALMRDHGMGKSQAIAIAIANMKKGEAGKWGKKKSGAPGKASAQTQGKSAGATTQWEKMKADEKSGVGKSEFTIRSEISKVDEDQRIVFGWAYCTHDELGNLNVDKSGEFIDDPEELAKSAYDFVLDSRVGGQNHERQDGTAVPRSTLIESVVFTPEKIEALGIPDGVLPTGWWTGWKVHNEDSWDDIKTGRATSFSIHGTGLRKAVKAKVA